VKRAALFALLATTGLLLLSSPWSSAYATQGEPSTVAQKKASALREARSRIASSKQTRAKTSSVGTKKSPGRTQKNKKYSKTTPVQKSTKSSASPPRVQESAQHRAKQAAAAQKKSTLETQQKNLKTELSSIRQALAQKANRVENANAALRESEKAISKSNRSLKELAEKKSAASARLADLKTEAQIVGLKVHEAEDVVSAIGQAQFLNSMRHPWQAALAGGNPNELSRHTAILGYLAQEQDRTIDRLEHRQRNIDAVARKTEAARRELSRIETAERQNREELEKEKTSRAIALKDLKDEIKTQQERYELLVKSDQELSGLISQIDRQIEQAAREERARIAAEEARLAAAAELERARTAQQKRRLLPLRPSPLEQRAAARRVTVAPTVGNFGSLKGKLTVPVRGTIVARFGQRREGAASSLPWRGLMIQARTGENVRATAAGTVVFSDWMRGFGNLLILDHGSNYLSVYANNESLFKSVGDRVIQGDVIASVGHSGGGENPGLYFELRYKGKPFDPKHWLAR